MDEFRYSSKTLRTFYVGVPIAFFGSYILAIGAIVLALFAQIGGVLVLLVMTGLRMFSEVRANRKKWALSTKLHTGLYLAIVTACIVGLIAGSIAASNAKPVGNEQELEGDGSMGTMTKTEVATVTIHDVYLWRLEHKTENPLSFASMEGFSVTSDQVSLFQVADGQPDENPLGLFEIGFGDGSLSCLYLPDFDPEPIAKEVEGKSVIELLAGEFEPGSCASHID